MDPQSRFWDGRGEMVQHLQEQGDPLDHYLALYDSEISYVDDHIDKLIERLNLDRDTLIIIASDHGEEFQEHGEGGHGKNLYQETVRVPLVVKLPGHLKGAVMDRPISLIDVMPTVLDMMGITPPPDITDTSCWQKKHLLPWLKGRVTNNGRDYSYAELDTRRCLKAIFSTPWKYIHDFANSTGQLYNSTADPWETDDRAEENTDTRDQLRGELLRWAETSKRYPTTNYAEQLPPERMEQLNGLGYL